MEKILFHICCGPCATASVQKLKADGYEVTGFYYNPNIYPESEYAKRLQEARRLAELDEMQFIVPAYNPREYDAVVKGVEEDQEERCRRCWELRLRETAKVAAGRGLKNIGTSLRISPYQNQVELLALAKKISGERGLNFYALELTPYYPESVKLSKDLGMYRQRYCGCRFSLDEVQKKSSK